MVDDNQSCLVTSGKFPDGNFLQPGLTVSMPHRPVEDKPFAKLQTKTSFRLQKSNKNPKQFGFYVLLCRKEDLNIHVLLRSILSRVRLPFRHSGNSLYYNRQREKSKSSLLFLSSEPVIWPWAI